MYTCDYNYLSVICLSAGKITPAAVLMVVTKCSYLMKMLPFNKYTYPRVENNNRGSDNW